MRAALSPYQLHNRLAQAAVLSLHRSSYVDRLDNKKTRLRITTVFQILSYTYTLIGSGYRGQGRVKPSMLMVRYYTPWVILSAYFKNSELMIAQLYSATVSPCYVFWRYFSVLNSRIMFHNIISLFPDILMRQDFYLFVQCFQTNLIVFMALLL